MAGYNLTRYVEELLDENESSPPSFTVHLYPEHWTLNNGSKFLYNNPVASLLDDIRAQRIPVDFLELFDSAKVPFYDGCMIVELLDYRPPKGKDPVLEKPDRTRVVLTPNPETLWADICLLNQRVGLAWTDEDALEVESRILLATAPPLCLDPDPHLTRIANSILKASVPTTPISLKRKAAAMELEEDEMERARRAKIMQFMNPKINRSSGPSYRILDVLQRVRAQKTQPPAPSTAAAAPTAAPVAPAPSPSPHPVAGPPTAVVNGTPHPPAAINYPIAVATAARSTPAPIRNPTPAPAPTPTPPIRVPSVAPDTKKKGKSSEAGQSPATPRPPSTIPPHLQSHAQVGRSTPVPPQITHTPRPPSVVSMTRSPVERPTSATKLAQSHTPQPPQRLQPSPAQQSVPVTNSQSLQPPQAVPVFQAPNTNFQQAPKKKPPPPNAHPQQAHMPMQMMYAQPYYQQHMNQPRLAQSTPNPAASSASQTPSQGTSARNSPMVAAQSLTSRSPMPQNPNQAALTHQQQSYNYAAMQYSAQMRPMPHPQLVQHHLAPGAPQGNAAAGQPAQGGQSSQDQPTMTAPMMPQYPMFPVNYPMTAVQPGRIPQQYWQLGLGRGMAPVANGQHPMPGMVGHPPQMALGAGKVPGGMQGS